MQPIQRPEKLPALPAGLDLGQLPSVTDLEAAVAAAFSGRQAPEVKAVPLSHGSDLNTLYGCMCHQGKSCMLPTQS